MATESIGQMVYLTNEIADRIIEAQARVDANPPVPRTREIKWGDPDEIMAALRREYGIEK
ncbi:hypothetical protein AGMMS49983_17680 [Clostridia bacterium]|nr:hypothetical protein AGMMS49983_17680 [Clostridia bacterium]